MFLRTRAEGCAAIARRVRRRASSRRCSTSSTATRSRSSRAAIPERRAGHRPAGSDPDEAGFALIVEVDGTRAQAEAQREGLLEVLGPASRRRARAGGRRRAVALAGRHQRGGHGRARGEGQRGRRLPDRAPGRGARAVSSRSRRARAALVRVGARGRGQRARDGARGSRARATSSTRREAVGEELFALVISLGGSVAGEHGIGWLKRGRLQAQWDERAVALHEQIKRAFDPKGLLNPGKKLARYLLFDGARRELELPTFDYTDPSMRGERFHAAMRRAALGGLARGGALRLHHARPRGGRVLPADALGDLPGDEDRGDLRRERGRRCMSR